MSGERRIAYIDGLRAVAVLTVVASHAAVNKTAFWRFGAHGIDLFFVISGFCLAYPSLCKIRECGAAPFDVGRFFAHRLTRILPPYYAAIAVLSILGAAVAAARVHLPDPGSLTTPPGGDIVRQMLFLDAPVQFLTSPFWTLAVEFRWYLFFPIALLVWIRSPRAFFALSILCIVAGATRASSLDLVILPAFLLGIVAAHIQVFELPVRPAALAAFVPLLFWAVRLQPAFVPGTNFMHPVWQLAAFTAVVAAGSPIVRSVFSAAPAAFVGAASYSIYLVHLPVIALAEAYRVPPVAAATLGVAAGAGFFLAVERQFLNPALRRRLIASLSKSIGRGLRGCGVPESILLEPSQRSIISTSDALTRSAIAG